MWIFDSTLLQIIARSAIIYFVVLIGIRLAGKREVGQMTPFDLVLLLLLANVVQNAMTGPDTSLTGGLVGAATLLGLNAIISRIVSRNRSMRRMVEGTPTLLIYRGTIVKNNLDKEGVAPPDLHQALREHGIATIEDVYMATLEVDGSISVIKNDERPAVVQPHHRIRFTRHAH